MVLERHIKIIKYFPCKKVSGSFRQLTLASHQTNLAIASAVVFYALIVPKPKNNVIFVFGFGRTFPRSNAKMNKKSKLLQQRNERVQKRFSEELARTPDKKTTILSIYAILAVEFDLSIERVREIVNFRRI